MYNNSVKIFQLTISVVCWYCLTILSAIYSKDFLQTYNDPITMTMASFLCGAFLVPFFVPFKQIREVSNNHMIRTLALLNVGLTFMTNIGMKNSSVAFTYMIKTLEPVGTAFLLTFIAGKVCTKNVNTALTVLFVGVLMAVFGELNVSFIALIAVIISTVSSSSRNFFFNHHTTESKPVDLFITYLNVNLIGLILFSPIFIANHFNSNSFDKYKSASLAFGAIFNCSFNLISFYVLNNTLATVSYSVVGFIKRIVVIAASTIYFQNTLTELQAVGLLIANVGILMYVKFKNSQNDITSRGSDSLTINKKRRTLILVALLVLIYGFGCFEIINKTNQEKPFEIAYATNPVMSELSSSEVGLKMKKYNEKRKVCLDKIRTQIRDGFKDIFGEIEYAHLMGFPVNKNHGDVFIWVGQCFILKELGIKLGYTCEQKKCLFQSSITPSDVIALQGGGNFGDLYHDENEFRLSIMKMYPKNKFVIFSQSVKYNNETIINLDREAFSKYYVHLALRQQQSFDFIRQYFPNITSYSIPDAAFMIGNVETDKYVPKYDVLIIRRITIESNSSDIKTYFKTYWKPAIKFLKKLNKTYHISSWLETPYFKRENDLVKRGSDILNLSVKLLSKGKIIMTDALHATILSVLMNKPHIYVDNGYRKLIGTRGFAFQGKEECNYTYLRAQRADDPLDAAKRAVKMLDNNLFVD